MFKSMDTGIQNLDPSHSLQLESQTDGSGNELAPRPLTRSGGDFINNTESSLHFPSPKSSQTDSDIKSSDDETIRSNEVELDKRISSYNSVGNKLKAELSRYKLELREYNNTTRDLENKYRKINTELNEMQQKHERFVAKRKTHPHDNKEASSSNTSFHPTSDHSLQRKKTQVFKRQTDKYSQPDETELDATYESEHIMHSIAKKEKHQCPAPHINEYGGLRTTGSSSLQLKRKLKRKLYKDKELSCDSKLSREQTASLKSIYKALRHMLDDKAQQKPITYKNLKLENSKKQLTTDEISDVNVHQLQHMLSNLQTEQSKSHALIQQQQKCLQDYQKRCMEAHKIVHTQKLEINHLHTSNVKLEEEFTTGIEQLRVKIDAKLREVAHLPKMIRDERENNDKMCRENKSLSERVRILQNEATQLKHKLEELTKRKASVISRLRTAERDLKIFKNHNLALKNEKKKLNDELMRLKEQVSSSQGCNKRLMNKQKDQFEKQRRDLQKRIYELELKLNRSQKSSAGIIQERDKLISELQGQLNTLVHNFEVSQKHIRVLRRHIYSMPQNSQNPPVTPNAGGTVRAPLMRNLSA